jgi:hypothetical protein
MMCIPEYWVDMKIVKETMKEYSSYFMIPAM